MGNEGGGKRGEGVLFEHVERANLRESSGVETCKRIEVWGQEEESLPFSTGSDYGLNFLSERVRFGTGEVEIEHDRRFCCLAMTERQLAKRAFRICEISWETCWFDLMVHSSTTGQSTAHHQYLLKTPMATRFHRRLRARHTIPMVAK